MKYKIILNNESDREPVRDFLTNLENKMNYMNAYFTHNFIETDDGFVYSFSMRLEHKFPLAMKTALATQYMEMVGRLRDRIKEDTQCQVKIVQLETFV